MVENPKKVAIPGTTMSFFNAGAAEIFQLCAKGTPGPEEDHVVIENGKGAQYLCADALQKPLGALGLWPINGSWKQVLEKLQRIELERGLQVLENYKSPASQKLFALEKISKNWENPYLQENEGRAVNAVSDLLDHEYEPLRFASALFLSGKIEDRKISEIFLARLTQNTDSTTVEKIFEELERGLRAGYLPPQTSEILTAYIFSAANPKLKLQGLAFLAKIDSEAAVRAIAEMDWAPYKSAANGWDDFGFSNALAILVNNVDWIQQDPNLTLGLSAKVESFLTTSDYYEATKYATEWLLKVHEDRAIAFLSAVMEQKKEGYGWGILKALIYKFRSYRGSVDGKRIGLILANAVVKKQGDSYCRSSIARALCVYPHEEMRGLFKKAIDDRSDYGSGYSLVADLTKALSKLDVGASATACSLPDDYEKQNCE